MCLSCDLFGLKLVLQYGTSLHYKIQQSLLDKKLSFKYSTSLKDVFRVLVVKL